jgi:hypothetical protein
MRPSFRKQPAGNLEAAVGGAFANMRPGAVVRNGTARNIGRDHSSALTES